MAAVAAAPPALVVAHGPSMPEGHTLHRIAGELAEVFVPRRVRACSPQGRFADSAALIDGAILRSVEAAGKHLLVQFSARRWLHVHLGLIGSFTVTRAIAVPPRGAVRLRLQTRRAYADLRGPTTCALIAAAERDALLGRLGPDPLRDDADPVRAWCRISRSQAPLAALLLQQEILAGVGNVYRAELLFRHHVDPYLAGRRLREDQWWAMWTDLVDLMHEGVRTGQIDTVRPEQSPVAMRRPPRVDDHGGEVYVYRRAGLPCLVCGTPIRSTVLTGRNLFWCPVCQHG